MQMQEVDEVRELYNVEDVNKALAEGWKLLTVVAAALSPALGGQAPAQARVYVLGRQKGAPKQAIPDISKALKDVADNKF